MRTATENFDVWHLDVLVILYVIPRSPSFSLLVINNLLPLGIKNVQGSLEKLDCSLLTFINEQFPPCTLQTKYLSSQWSGIQADLHNRSLTTRSRMTCEVRGVFRMPDVCFGFQSTCCTKLTHHTQYNKVFICSLYLGCSRDLL